MEVDEDDYVSVGSEEFMVPAVRPLVSHWNFGAAVNDELQRIFFVGIEVRWANEEALDFVVICTHEPEGFQRGHGDLRERRTVQMRHLFSTLTWRRKASFANSSTM